MQTFDVDIYLYFMRFSFHYTHGKEIDAYLYGKRRKKILNRGL